MVDTMMKNDTLKNVMPIWNKNDRPSASGSTDWNKSNGDENITTSSQNSSVLCQIKACFNNIIILKASFAQLEIHKIT